MSGLFLLRVRQLRSSCCNTRRSCASLLSRPRLFAPLTEAVRCRSCFAWGTLVGHAQFFSHLSHARSGLLT